MIKKKAKDFTTGEMKEHIVVPGAKASKKELDFLLLLIPINQPI